MNIRTRIAPSPTGEDLHIGTLYTALLNFAYAKKHNGQFIVRIEDTDRTRLIEGSEEKMLSTLKKFGLVYDEGPDIDGKFTPYRQSDRLEIYKKYALLLIEKKAAYYCFCTKERLEKLKQEQTEKKQIPRYDKHCQGIENSEARIKNGENYVVRLNILPDKKIWFDDAIRGRIQFDSNQIDDQVLLKSDGFPTYHLAVVVDDHLMEITHVIRGEDWISSTPKHIILYESYGWEKPIFAHIPLLRNPDHSKLSKRKNPVWASWYLEQGYLKEAILNFLVLMGWSHPEQKEIFDLDEFIKVFDLKDLHAVGPVFDLKKLEWMNGEYIRKLQISNFKLQISNFYKSKYSENSIEKVYPIIRERIKTLKEFGEMVDPFFEKQTLDLSSEDQELRDKLKDALSAISDWSSESITSTLKNFAKEKNINFKKYYKILFGVETGLPLGEMFFVIGKEETLQLFATSRIPD